MKTSTKLMAIGIILSIGWVVLAACECDETKEDQFPGFWVACVDNKPTLMTYNHDNPTIISTDPAGNFNPAQYDCSHSGSPQYKGSEATSPYKLSSPAGPEGFAVAHRNTVPNTTSTTPATYIFMPQQLQFLPFTPDIPPAATPPQCDSTYPDIFQTQHTLALLTRIGTCPFTIKAQIPVQTRPLQVAITPDGTMAIVTSFDNAVNFISLATNTVVYTLDTDPSINPMGIAISNDGTLAYVTSFNTNFPAVEVINIQTHQVVTNIETSMTYPSGETISPDGSQLWVTSTLDNGVDVIDLATNTRVITLPINLATDVAFDSVGARAYITSASPNPGVAGKVYVVNTQTYQVLSTYTVGQVPADIQMSYGDGFLVVNNSADGTISVIDLIQNQVKTSVKLGNSVSGLAWVH